MSWELLFQINLFGVLLAPILFRVFRHRKALIFLFLMLLFPLTTLLQFSIDREGDFPFHLKLAFLHGGVSIVTLGFLVWCARSTWQLCEALLFSFIISIALLILTPSLAVIDPVWGLIPGTISIDPIIHLNFYYLRLGLVAAAVAFFLFFGLFFVLRPLVLILFFFGIALLSGFLSTHPFSLTMRLNHDLRFQITDSDHFVIHSENEKPAGYPLSAWLSEFRFHLLDLQSKLQNSLSLNDLRPLRFDIYLYESDLAKYERIGAERAQIGNFVRSEMHLSEVEPFHEVLRHELTHLLHGKIRASLRSYVDPFLFEGFAVALSSHDNGETERKAAALLSQLDPSHFHWPRGAAFFERYNPTVSYRLAGGFASKALSQKRFPWDADSISIQDFHNTSLSESDIKEARELLNRKSFLKNPRARDCARLFVTVQTNPSFKIWEQFAGICHNSPLAFEATYLLRGIERELALNVLNQTPHPLKNLIQGDLWVLQEKWKEALHFYSVENCSLTLCEGRRILIERRKGDELKRALLGAEDPDRAILLLAAPLDHRFYRPLLLSFTTTEGFSFFQNFKGALTEELRIQKIRFHFYHALQSGNQTKTLLDQFLSELKSMRKESSLLFRRISFERKLFD